MPHEKSESGLGALRRVVLGLGFQLFLLELHYSSGLL